MVPEVLEQPFQGRPGFCLFSADSVSQDFSLIADVVLEVLIKLLNVIARIVI